MKKNNSNEKTNKNKIIKIVLVIIIIILLAIIGTLYEKNDDVRIFFDKYIFRKDIEENNLPKISIEGENNLNLYSYDGKILMLNKNILTVYNKYATQEYNLDVEIVNPIFASSDKYLCVAEQNGQKIYVISGENIIWQKTLEGNISDVSINKNGYVAVSITGQSYKTIVETYNSEGKMLFSTYLSSTYVIDTDISDNNEYLAIAEANFSGIMIQSNVKVISVKDATSGKTDSIKYTHSSENGDLIVNLEYNKDNVLSCIYDNHISIINEDKSTGISNFETEEVLFADFNEDIIKVVKKEKREVELQIVNATNQNMKTYSIDEPKGIYTYGNITAVNLGSEVLFINNNGWLVRRYKSSQEINKIVLSEDIAGIVYNNKIEVVSL